MVQASGVQHATFTAFRTVMLKALESGYSERSVAVSAPRSITPTTRPSRTRSAALVHSRCYASSSKAAHDSFQHHFPSDTYLQGRTIPLPHSMQRIVLDNSSQPQDDGFGWAPDSSTSIPPPLDPSLSLPIAAKVEPLSNLSSASSSLPTYNTSFSRIAHMARKKRAIQARQKAEEGFTERLFKVLPSQDITSSKNFTPRARITLSDLNQFVESSNDDASYVPTVSECRTMLRNGQLFQGMNAFRKIFDANMSRRDYLPFQEPPPQPQQRMSRKQRKLRKLQKLLLKLEQNEVPDQNNSRQKSKSPAVESVPLHNDEILSPRDILLIAKDIKRLVSGEMHLDLSKETNSRSPVWCTNSLPANVNPLELPRPVLCAHALATIFDSTVALGYDPPEQVGAILLSCFAQSMPLDCYRGAADLLVELHGLDGMGLAILSSMMAGYSRLGQQDIADKLLEDFGCAQAHLEQEQERQEHMQQSSALEPTKFSGPTQVHFVPSTEIPLHGWSSDGAIWCSMIRGKILSGDVPAAYQWLSHFRQVRRECIAGNIPSSLMPPPSYTPYLTLMSGLEWRAVRERTKQDLLQLQKQQSSGTDVSDEGGKSSLGSPQEDAKIWEIVQVMREDEIDFSPQVLNFIAQFARRRRRADITFEALQNMFTMDRKSGTWSRANRNGTWDAPAISGTSIGADLERALDAPTSSATSIDADQECTSDADISPDTFINADQENISDADISPETLISADQENISIASLSSLGLGMDERTARASSFGRRLLTQDDIVVSSSDLPERLLTIGRTWDSHAFAGMFDMLYFKPRSRDEMSNQDEEGDKRKGDGIVQGRRVFLRMNARATAHIPLRPRTMFQTMLARHVLYTRGDLTRPSVCLSTRTLHKALRCALSRRYRDFPLALAILQTYRVCNLDVKTDRVFSLVSAAAECQAEEARRMKLENGEAGDHSSPTHTAHLFAAGLNEDKRTLSEWEWIDDHAVWRNAERNESMDKALSAATGQAEAGAAELEELSAPLPDDASLYEIKIKAMISLKNLVRWTIFQRVERLVQLHRLRLLAARSRKGAAVVASFEPRDAEWDWTRSASSSSGIPILDQFHALAKDRQIRQQEQRDAPQPSTRTEAGETEDEWRLSRLCVEDVWKGVFDLCANARKGRGGSEYVWEWEEDEIVQIRRDRRGRMRRQHTNSSFQKWTADGGGEGVETETSSVVGAPSKDIRGDAAKSVQQGSTETSEVENEATAEGEAVTKPVPVKRGRGRPRRRFQVSFASPAKTASAPRPRGRPRKHAQPSSQTPTHAPTVTASAPSRGRGRPKKDSPKTTASAPSKGRGRPRKDSSKVTVPSRGRGRPRKDP